MKRHKFRVKVVNEQGKCDCTVCEADLIKAFARGTMQNLQKYKRTNFQHLIHIETSNGLQTSTGVPHKTLDNTKNRQT